MLTVHNDRIFYMDPGESVKTSVVYSETNMHILDHKEHIPNAQLNRHIMGLRRRRTTDYGNPNFRLS